MIKRYNVEWIKDGLKENQWIDDGELEDYLKTLCANDYPITAIIVRLTKEEIKKYKDEEND